MAADKKNNVSAALWLVWLIGQLTVTVTLLLLSGAYFGLERSQQCGLNQTDDNVSSNTNNTTGAPSCGFSAAILGLALFACIVSVVDATINLHDIIHEVGFENDPKPSNGSTTKQVNPNGHNCATLELSCGCISKSSMNTVRVCYCWILVHAILITIAANTYEWTWETNSFSMLVNTVMFFFTSIVYLLLIVAVLMWHCCRYTTTDETESEGTNDEATVTVDKKRKKEIVEKTFLVVFLIVSNGFCLAATLFTFFLPQKEYSNRIPGLVMVLLYVIVTSISWFILDKRYLNCLSISLMILILIVSAMASILVITLVIINPQNSEYFSLIFIGPLLLWIIILFSVWVCILYVEWLKKSQIPKKTAENPSHSDYTDMDETSRFGRCAINTAPMINLDESSET